MPITPCKFKKPKANLHDNKGMAPSIWGPLVWRLVHGMAKEYDNLEDTIRFDQMLIFIRFLQVISFVLPCYDCRESYTDYILSAHRDGSMHEAFRTATVMHLTFMLHNRVNQKLNKPQFINFELVQRRSEVWDCEFMDSELLGMAFIVALNYTSNKEADKAKQYMAFLGIIVDLLRALRPESELIDAFEAVAWSPTESLDQEHIMLYLTRVYNIYNNCSTSSQELAERYGLCRT